MTIKTMKKDGRSKNKINSKPSAIKMFTYLGPLFLKKGPHWPIPRIKNSGDSEYVTHDLIV